MMKDVEAMVKQSPTAMPGQPMPLNSATVPRGPSRTSMKASRNRPANRQRQKTIVQLSEMCRKRAMAPPKLQKKAEPKTSRAPSFSLAANGAEVADGSVMASCPGAGGR
mgnify:CR=1 FL=1